MIDEQLEEQASLYVLGVLEFDKAAAFEARLAGNVELQRLVDSLQEAAASLAHSAPPRMPPPELEGKIMQAIRSEKQTTHASSARNWIPWALAASLALSTAVLFLDRSRIGNNLGELEARNARAQEELAALAADRDAAAKKVAELERRDLDSRAELATLTRERETIAQQLTELEERDSLSQMQIATLTSKLAEAPRATAFVIWDAKKQRGVLTAVDVPPSTADHDYQLWVVDPKYPFPVDAGVFTVDTGGVARIPFKPKSPITSANAFAVSRERKGGVPKAEGPMVLLGK